MFLILFFTGKNSIYMIKYLQKSGKSDFFLLIVCGKFISSRCLFGEGDILIYS